MTLLCQFQDITLTTDKNGKILKCSDPERVKRLCMEGRHGFYIIGLSSKQFGLYSLEYYYHDYSGRACKIDNQERVAIES